MTEDEFDRTLNAIEEEGRAAFKAGLPKESNPYRDNPEPHFSNAWRGGYAEERLEFLIQQTPE